MQVFVRFDKYDLDQVFYVVNQSYGSGNLGIHISRIALHQNCECFAVAVQNLRDERAVFNLFHISRCEKLIHACFNKRRVCIPKVSHGYKKSPGLSGAFDFMGC